MRKTKKGLDILISGYYGHSCIGDDAILSNLLSAIDKSCPGCRIGIICKSPPPLPRLSDTAVEFIAKGEPFSILSALWKAKVFISGGGSLLQDTSSKRSLIYYTSLIRIAHFFSCKVFLYANGIGPLKCPRLARRALLCAHIISVRDPDSLTLAKSLCPKKEPLLSADPIFLRDPIQKRTNPPSCFASLSGKAFFAVSLRKCPGLPDIDTRPLEKVIARLKREGYTPVFVSMQDKYDLELCRDVQKRTGGVIANIASMEDLALLLEKASLAVGMRLHFLLCSAMVKTPCVALSYDCKVKSAMEYLGLPSALDAFFYTEGELAGAIIRARRLFSKTALASRCEELSALAHSDTELITELLREGEKEEAAGEISP